MQPRTTRPKPVLARGVPIGRANNRRQAIRLAYRYLGHVERALVDAGFRLRVHDGSRAFSITLAK